MVIRTPDRSTTSRAGNGPRNGRTAGSRGLAEAGIAIHVRVSSTGIWWNRAADGPASAPPGMASPAARSVNRADGTADRFANTGPSTTCHSPTSIRRRTW